MTDLDAFLRAEQALPPYPGCCCRMADRWWRSVTGYSALARFGRDFETDADVRLWLAEPGGLAVAVNRVMRASGAAKTKAPAVGDVGLVFVGERMAMAILSARGWAGRDDAGFFTVRHFWKAWECRKRSA